MANINRTIVATDPRRVEQGDWSDHEAERLESNGNLTLVRFEDGSEQWLAPHEWRAA